MGFIVIKFTLHHTGYRVLRQLFMRSEHEKISTDGTRFDNLANRRMSLNKPEWDLFGRPANALVVRLIRFTCKVVSENCDYWKLNSAKTILLRQGSLAKSLRKWAPHDRRPEFPFHVEVRQKKHSHR